jgi:Endonuclease/Exonuclease/phosphatase family
MEGGCRILSRSMLRLLLVCLFAVSAAGAPLQIRVATFNASLNRNTLGQLASDLSTTTNNQAKRVAEIIQRAAPDIILINEFDYDASNPTGPTSALTRFHDNYLAVSQNGQAVLNYPYRYVAPSNTGVPTGATAVVDGDFDNNGTVDTTPGDQSYGNDCFGFGEFPGKFSFAVYSKFPILTAQIRTFQLFKWKDMPGASLPTGWYTASELNIFRLSSKNHVDLPIELKPGHVLHLLTSHPTPPAFDGAEDRNGHRNFDEIRLWADYINNASYLRDDAGVAGGIDDDQRFIILGDMNADPKDGDSLVVGGVRAINQLRNHPRVNASFNPSSPGGTQQSQIQGGVNASHQGDPALDTSDFFDGSGGAGNLRVDHILPSKVGLNPVGGGVFWPLNTDPAFGVLYLSASQTQSNQTTDHRLVWMDFAVVPVIRQAVRQLRSEAQGSDVVLTWGTQSGVTYKVEQSVDLATWTDTPTIPIVFNDPILTATATHAGGLSGPQRFYRIVTTLDTASPVTPLRLRTFRRARR